MLGVNKTKKFEKHWSSRPTLWSCFSLIFAYQFLSVF